jgi:hypothetical protein
MTPEGITINITTPAPELTAPTGTYDTYDEAMGIAIQSRRTHPKEAVILEHSGEKWNVKRVIV